MKTDGRGGPRPGSGRPKKADEIKMIEQMDAIAAPEDAWRKLWDLCEAGDTQAVKTWINYRFGMPTQKQTVDLNIMQELTEKISAIFPDDE